MSPPDMLAGVVGVFPVIVVTLDDEGWETVARAERETSALPLT